MLTRTLFDFEEYSKNFLERLKKEIASYYEEHKKEDEMKAIEKEEMKLLTMKQNGFWIMKKDNNVLHISKLL